MALMQASATRGLEVFDAVGEKPMSHRHAGGRAQGDLFKSELRREYGLRHNFRFSCLDDLLLRWREMTDRERGHVIGLVRSLEKAASAVPRAYSRMCSADWRGHVVRNSSVRRSLPNSSSPQKTSVRPSV